jgi:tetratricopeptide (TPR) repeat protein
MAGRRHRIGNDNRVFRGTVIILFLVLVWGSAIQGQEARKSDTPSQKVKLRWKFQPNQVFIGKLATGFQTTDNNPQQTSIVYDFEWNVQSRDKDGRAVVKVVIPRVRFRHRSAKVKVDYDSNNDGAFAPSKTDLSEIEVFLTVARQFRKQEFLFLFSDRGEIQQFQKYEVRPGQMIDWPVLPEQPVGVGDTWTDDTHQGEPVRFELVKLEELEGATIAWIENKSNTMRYRFLVNEGRYLDNVKWDILRTPPGAKNSYVHSRSQRLRLELAGEKGRFDRLNALQPNQPGRALNLISKSLKQTDSIEGFLLDEKSALSSIQERLFVEHVDRIDTSGRSDQWNPFDWSLFARYYQRTGNIEKYKELLEDGAESTAVNLKVTDSTRNVFLLQFADLLASIGEYDAAKKAGLAIDLDAMSGLAVTAMGPISIPKSALRSYALFLIAREQGKAGLADKATSTAQLISNPYYLSAAHWIVAMHLAEHGKTKTAMENVAFAEKSYSEAANVIEFDTKGPIEVPIHSYQALALGKLAISQAKQMDESAMRNTLAKIKNPTERNAVLVDLIVALDKAGMTKKADRIMAELPKSMQNLATQMRISMRLKSKVLGEVEQMIASISEAEWNASSRLEYCMALRSDNDRTNELQKQLDLAGAAIREISEPRTQASMIIEYASVLIKTGRQQEAKKQLKTALEIVDQDQSIYSQSLEMQLRIADVLAKTDDATGFASLMGRIESTVNGLVKSERANNQLLVVLAYLQKDDMERAETLAEKIEDASFRCKALAAVGKRYAQHLELERSRELFAKAYASAMQVIDVGGLDTLHSKGGAVRYVGQQQGECDFEGLVNYMEESPNANIRAYGLVGGVESFDPAAAEAAMRVAKLPEGILMDVCESNVACKIIQGQLQLFEENLKASEMDRP